MTKRKKTPAKKPAPKTRKPAASAAQVEKPSLLSQLGVMRLTAGLMRSAAQAIADAGTERPIDLRQFITNVETRREIMRAVLTSHGTPELFDANSEYGVAVDATLMFWIADEMDTRIEQLLSSLPTSIRGQV